MQFDDIDNLSDDNNGKNFSIQKKFLIVLIIALVIVASFVAVYNLINKRHMQNSLPYKAVQLDNSENALPLLLYNMPEIATRLKTPNSEVSMKITLEFEGRENVEKVEALLPKINDTIVFMTSELYPSELEGSKGLFWFKEEMLHRINLMLDPVVVENLSFRSFELIGAGEENR